MNLLCFLCSIALLVTSALIGATRMHCPVGWHNNGIRPTGQFECTRVPVGDPEWDGTWLRPERGHVPAGELRSRIHCTNGFQPIVVNERTVGCQRVAPGRAEREWYPVAPDVDLRELPPADRQPAAAGGYRY